MIKKHRSLTASCCVCALWACAGHTHAGTTTVAVTSQSAPDADGQFSGFNVPTLSNSGQAAFSAGITGSMNGNRNEGVFLGSGGIVTQVARRLDAIPGDPGTFYSDFSMPTINALGNVAFRSSLIGAFNGQAIFRGGADPVTELLRTGAGLTTLDRPSLNGSGQVAVLANVTGGNAVFQGNSNPLPEMAGTGDDAPDRMGVDDGKFDFIAVPSFDGAGQAVFHASVSLSSSTKGLFRTQQGGGVTAIAREDDLSPDLNGNFADFGGLSATGSINSSGQVAFFAALVNTSGMIFDNEGLFIGDGTTTEAIVRRGHLAPATFNETPLGYLTFNRPVINDDAAIAFISLITTANGNNRFEGVFTIDDNGLHLAHAIEGGAAPNGSGGTNGTFEDFGIGAVPGFNNNGQTMFFAQMEDTTDGNQDNVGIFLADGEEVVQVVRIGDNLLGATINELNVITEPDLGGESSLNDAGQVAYQAMLSNGNEGVFIYTPDLHWRSETGGDWDTAVNWTLSIQPGQVHDTLIDPVDGLVVQGPAAASTSVKSLVVGALSTGIAELNLQAGTTLIAENGVDVIDRGKLSGNGTVNGALDNAGNVAPGDSAGVIAVIGPYTQEAPGVLEIEIGGLLAGVDYDRLAVTGDVSLAGTLDVQEIDGFEILPNDSFDVLLYTSRQDDSEFDTVTLPGLPVGLTMDVVYDTTSLTLDFSAIGGDANLDGFVDLTDLTILAINFETPFEERRWKKADFDGNGFTNLTDLTILAINFGATPNNAGSGASIESLAASIGIDLASTTVPEPGTTGLIVAGCTLLLGRCRRSQRA